MTKENKSKMVETGVACGSGLLISGVSNAVTKQIWKSDLHVVVKYILISLSVFAIMFEGFMLIEKVYKRLIKWRNEEKCESVFARMENLMNEKPVEDAE